jgi:hypothetical protein
MLGDPLGQVYIRLVCKKLPETKHPSLSCGSVSDAENFHCEVDKWCQQRETDSTMLRIIAVARSIALYNSTQIDGDWAINFFTAVVNSLAL